MFYLTVKLVSEHELGLYQQEQALNEIGLRIEGGDNCGSWVVEGISFSWHKEENKDET